MRSLVRSQLSPPKQKRTSTTSVFCFGDDFLDRSSSRKARIWFAFPPKSASSSLVSGKAWNIAILCGTLRIANAGCLSNTRRQRGPFLFWRRLSRSKQLARSADLLRIPAEERVKLACKRQGVEYCNSLRNAKNCKCQLSFFTLKPDVNDVRFLF